LGLITLIMIHGTTRGTDARTVTDIPIGKHIPEVRGRRSEGRLNIKFEIRSTKHETNPKF
jgi:hypothetical protein